MIYIKPEVITLCDALTALQYLGPNYKESGAPGDGFPPPHSYTIPAYELDD